MQRAPDGKPKPNVVSFTQCCGSSTSSAARVCGHSQLCDSSRHLLLHLLQIHPGAMRTYSRWLAGCCVWLASSSALKQRTKFAASGRPRKRRRRSWRRLLRRPQPTTLLLINYFFLFWPCFFFFLGV